jgi:hypothetical protein
MFQGNFLVPSSGPNYVGGASSILSLRWTCAPSVVRNLRWQQGTGALRVKWKLECDIFSLQMGRRPWESWMAWRWGRSVAPRSWVQEWHTSRYCAPGLLHAASTYIHSSITLYFISFMHIYILYIVFTQQFTLYVYIHLKYCYNWIQCNVLKAEE